MPRFTTSQLSASFQAGPRRSSAANAASGSTGVPTRAPDRSAPDRSAPDRSAPDRSAPDRSAPDRSAPYRSLRAPYVLAVDAYTGCDLDCALCTAGLQPMARPATTFSQFLVRNRQRLLGGWAKVGEACDAYPLAEEAIGATRQLLEVAARLGLGVELFTRSPRVLRDLDLLQVLARRDALRITVKIPPAPRALTLSLEPGAGPAPERFELVRTLARHGLVVGVEATPLLPGGGDDRRSLGHLICAADEAGASYLRVSPLRFEKKIRGRLLERVGAVDPDLAARVERCFKHRTWSPRFAERAQATVGALRRTYGMAAGPSLPPVVRHGVQSAMPGPIQLGLFEAA